MLNKYAVLPALDSDAVNVRVRTTVLKIVDVVIAHGTGAVREDDPVLNVADIVGEKRT